MAVMWWFRGPSPHFTWKELSTTDTGLANWPISPHARLWLTKLTWGILEPLRKEYGPIIITSGFRTVEVNDAIPGAADNSQHQADLRTPSPPFPAAAVDLYADSGLSGYILAEWLYENQDTLPLDQVIIYATTGHLHVSTGGAYRKSFLEWDGEEYESWQPTA